MALQIRSASRRWAATVFFLAAPLQEVGQDEEQAFRSASPVNPSLNNKSVLRIRITFNADPDPDPAFFPNADPDPDPVPDPDPDPGFFDILNREKKFLELSSKIFLNFFTFFHF